MFPFLYIKEKFFFCVCILILDTNVDHYYYIYRNNKDLYFLKMTVVPSISVSYQNGIGLFLVNDK